MEIEVRTLGADECRDAIDLLVAYEDAFFPPLSEEEFGLAESQDPEDMTQAEIARANAEEALTGEDVRIIGALDGDDVVGEIVVSLEASLESMSGAMDPCAYVYFVLVAEGYRRQGLAMRMYRYLASEVLPETGDEVTYLAQRAQAPNTASREMASRLGLEEYKRLEELGHTHIYYRRAIEDWRAAMLD